MSDTVAGSVSGFVVDSTQGFDCVSNSGSVVSSASNATDMEGEP